MSPIAPLQFYKKSSLGGPGSAFEPVKKTQSVTNVETIVSIRNERKMAFLGIRTLFRTNKTHNIST